MDIRKEDMDSEEEEDMGMNKEDIETTKERKDIDEEVRTI